MGGWSHGLFGCFDNLGICVIAFFAPCVQFGWNAEALGENCIMYTVLSLIPVLDIILLTLVRGRVRESKGIDGNLIEDCLMVSFCTFCTIAQEGQELQAGHVSAMARE